VRLREIPPKVYAREVLPLTAPLWAGRRSFREYVERTLAIAESPFGRRHYRTIGLYDGKTLVASFKRYERTMHHGARRLASIGFGAVFTPEELRGRGYASIMLAAALDRARKDGYELAFLFSDIRPHFYATLGFRELASRRFSLRADALPSVRLDLAALNDEGWSGLRRVFEQWESRREVGFLRNSAVWGWIRMRMRHAQLATGDPTNLVMRRRGRIVAYVCGVRAAQLDTYVLEEFAVADDASAAMVPALLRAAAGDLRRIAGWLPPRGARELIPKLPARKRTNAIFMIAPLGTEGTRLLHAAASGDDFCWATDHV
jgi:GNAT superfamily N-acetyltransferase